MRPLGLGCALRLNGRSSQRVCGFSLCRPLRTGFLTSGCCLTRRYPLKYLLNTVTSSQRSNALILYLGWFHLLFFFFPEFLFHRLVFLVLGLFMMLTARVLSESVVFYYGSFMTIGVILVILMILFQVMSCIFGGCLANSYYCSKLACSYIYFHDVGACSIDVLCVLVCL